MRHLVYIISFRYIVYDSVNFQCSHDTTYYTCNSTCKSKCPVLHMKYKMKIETNQEGVISKRHVMRQFGALNDQQS